MIFVDRTRVGIPKDLSGPSEGIRLEKEKVIKYFTSRSKPKEKIKFDAYNTDEIKNALKELFYGKCAYCETPLLAITAGDIEHFRPKALIKNEGENQVVPGYFYLAYEWDNLLLSCEKCNRAGGKKNQFPVDPKGKYYIDFKKGINATEEKCRLLLNPCVDHPEEHFIYLENGVIKEKTLQSGQGSKHAEASIKVYNLNRVELVSEREKHIQNIKYNVGLAVNIQGMIVEAKKTGNAALVILLEQQLQLILDHLYEFKNEKSRYAGLCQQLVDLYLEANKVI